jgi:dihydrolipoamide dehydrogenase
MENTTYDVIVIGAGPVGENVADRAVQGGLTAAIVEPELCTRVPTLDSRLPRA